ncbi:MAG: sigma-70 family RNA polymerase sigma factor [Planctomycetes bacterium]|nr:sigma-70 family RNA polymerase sigma factor [Planctomycetota bacterium]MCB9869521.1 sigma-70 family RNA polymerase sigma factor [Planctomycetota bacterium]
MPEDRVNGDLTAALHAASTGSAEAEEALFGIVYDDLRRMAKLRLARLQPGQTLQATALVHEAWLKIANGDKDWSGRAQFFGVVSRAMRNILVDDARRKASVKHGGGLARMSAESLAQPEREASPLEFLALHEALEDLERQDPRVAKVVMLRYFSGLGTGEIAGLLDLSERTVERDWRFARSWLQQRMTENGPPKLEGQAE